jgi:hypothetical protein
LPAGLEKTLEQPCALIAQQPAGDEATMIQVWHLEQINQAARSATPFIRTSENNPPDPDMDQSTGTHDARLLGNIEVAFV